MQYLDYLPWGESFVNEDRGFNARYTFTGKELDKETGYQYFGARYNEPARLGWLSVDPLSDKYPSFSPYVYCANNPVMHTDPDGRWFTEESQNQINTYKSTLITIKDNLSDSKIDKDRIEGIDQCLCQLITLENSDQKYEIEKTDNPRCGISYDKENGAIKIIYNSLATLGHETTHAYQLEIGELAYSIIGKCFLLSDVFDEIDAYRIQLAIDPFSIRNITTMDQINPFRIRRNITTMDQINAVFIYGFIFNNDFLYPVETTTPNPRNINMTAHELNNEDLSEKTIGEILQMYKGDFIFKK